MTVPLYGQQVGHLDRTDSDDPDFTYTAEYAASGRAPLSSRLPIAPRTYRSDRILPYLRGLLPENLQTRQQWAARLGTAPHRMMPSASSRRWGGTARERSSSPRRAVWKSSISVRPT
ncbi:HipA N-terminal domain-containing protein [Nocardioides sp. BYT-33-1]|uniref:HipA N-terminal domain-containing protein n=1 Tax=Nocardioides sp. BYT-33-1 TaxID=3416952 RepID=UPI003F52E854